MSNRLNWDRVRKSPDPKFPETSEKVRQEDLKAIENGKALREMLDFLSEQDLTDWEKNFVWKIENFFGERLSRKQLEKLKSIYQKYL